MKMRSCKRLISVFVVCFAMYWSTGLFVDAAITPEDFGVLFSSQEAVLSIPTSVLLVFLGVPGSPRSDVPIFVNKTDVLSLLRQALPDRTPVVSATTAFHDVEPLSVKFNMNYDATWPSAVFTDQLESRIQSESLPTLDPGLVEVPIEAVESFLDAVVSSELSTRSKPAPFAVVVIQTNTTRCINGNEYVYVDAGGKRMANWVSPSGVLILDVTASLVQRGSVHDTEGRVIAGTLPTLCDRNVAMFDQVPSGSLPLYQRLFVSKLVATIIRGIEAVFVPDLVANAPPSDAVALAKQLELETTRRAVPPVVPVVITVIYDHETKTNDDNFGMDLQAIGSAIRPALFPQQDVAVSLRRMSLSNSPHVAAALAKATSSSPVFVRSSRDGKILRQTHTFIEEDQLPSLLASAALEDGTDLSFVVESGAIHVVVLSLLHGIGGMLLDEVAQELRSSYAPSLEFENGEHVSVAEGMVFVLRNPRGATSTGCYIDSDVLMEDGSLVTPKVVSGLVHVLGHVAPVEHQWNRHKRRASRNYMWATGVHGTAGCFDRNAQTWLASGSQPNEQATREVSVSHTVALAARMNAVVLRLDASFKLFRRALSLLQARVFDQLYDPFSDDSNHTFHLESLFLFTNVSEALAHSHPSILALARRFQPHLRKFADMLGSAGIFVRRGDTAVSLKFSDTVHKEVAVFVEDVLAAASEVDSSLECCSRRHHIKKKGSEPRAEFPLYILMTGTIVGFVLLGLFSLVRRKSAKSKLM